MTHTAVNAHRALAVLGHLRSELTEPLLTGPWQDLSLHVFPTGHGGLQAKLQRSTCLWFVPESLPDMSGLDFIQLISDIRLADRFVLVAPRYDERTDRRASCLAWTTYCVLPLAPRLFPDLMESFLASPSSDRPP